MDKINAYKEILTTLDKHKELLMGDYSIDIVSKIKSRIRLLEISEEFSIDILDKDAIPEYCKLSEYEYIYLCGSEIKITCPDDGRQPKNERLYVLSFPAGAYIFCESYPKNIFKAFFNELKDYGAKYVDSANHSLYFSSDVAHCVHDDFKSLLKKYKNIVNDEIKEKRIESLKKELAALEGL